MARSATFTPRKDKTRKKSPWWISIPPKLSDDGKRQKRFFETKELAEGEIQRLKVRKENHGTAAKLLSPADEQQAVSALKLLRDKGITLQLSEVVGDYIKRWEQRNASVTLSYAWDAFIKSREERKRSAVHLRNLEKSKKRFSPIMEKLVSDITAKDIEKCLEGTAQTYRNALLREIRAVLNHGMKGGRKWLKENPVSDCEIIIPKLSPVKIYTPEEIGAILETTAKLYPELIPAVSLMAFAGIRPDIKTGEITRLEWEHLHLKDKKKRIELPETITKKAKLRTIEIRPALASWLEWHSSRGGKTTGLVVTEKPGVLRSKLRDIHSSAKVNRGKDNERAIQKRIQDGLRKSFASYLAHIEGREKAENELGHTGDKVTMERHYRAGVRDAEAKAFWKLRAPVIEKKGKGKIIPFSAAA
jgi:hypothetical protein